MTTQTVEGEVSMKIGKVWVSRFQQATHMRIHLTQDGIELMWKRQP